MKHFFHYIAASCLVTLCSILSSCVQTGYFKGKVSDKVTHQLLSDVEIKLHCEGVGRLEKILLTNLEGIFESPKVSCISNWKTAYLAFNKQGYMPKRVYFSDLDGIRNDPEDRIDACNPPESVPCTFFTVTLEPVTRNP